MRRPRGIGFYLLSMAGLCLFLAAQNAAAQNASIRRVHVLNAKDAVEIEVEASDHLLPQTQVLTGPDRLVVDFPNATPGAQLRSQSVNRGEVKSLRVGLFQSNPPITRLVLDLNSPQSYQVFPNGRTVIIKVTGAAEEADGAIDDFPPVTRPGLVNTSFPAASLPARPLALQTGPATRPSLDVSFRNGLLAIRANRASLSEVLFAVHQRTGAEVAIAAGAEQEQVVADIGPAPAPEVLAQLLNGSKFNFLILSSANDPRALQRVILSPRSEGAITQLPPARNNDDADDDEPQRAAIPPRAMPASAEAVPTHQLPPGPPPDMKTPPDDNTPD
jgi:hypothetical protein